MTEWEGFPSLSADVHFGPFFESIEPSVAQGIHVSHPDSSAWQREGADDRLRGRLGRYEQGLVRKLQHVERRRYATLPPAVWRPGFIPLRHVGLEMAPIELLHPSPAPRRLRPLIMPWLWRPSSAAARSR